MTQAPCALQSAPGVNPALDTKLSTQSSTCVQSPARKHKHLQSVGDRHTALRHTCGRNATLSRNLGASSLTSGLRWRQQRCHSSSARSQLTLSRQRWSHDAGKAQMTLWTILQVHACLVLLRLLLPPHGLRA